mgnify:CR=1 FL=1|tara:strand:- start:936 stop:1130 length:195 start_codon:yes stop_codon:yes gene_type:complete
MKNTTVEELIETLKKMNPKSVVCNLEIENDKPIYNTFEICKEFKNVTYINDNGDEEKGDVVAIY